MFEYVINVFTMNFYSRRLRETRQIPEGEIVEGANSIFLPLDSIVSIVIKKFRPQFMRILSQFDHFFLRLSTIYRL